MRRLARKLEFIRTLAKFLAGDQAAKSISLKVEATREPGFTTPKWASEWAELRHSTPLFGYPTVEEAERTLKEFLL